MRSASLSGGCYETTLPELAFGGHEDSMYCSLVMADEGTTDGLTLFLSYFTGDTNELYMLNLMQSSDGLYFDATDIGNVGDSVWPATVNRVYGNASIKGIQTAEAAAEKNDIELTAQTVSAEKIERSTQEASGSLNTVSNAAAPAAQRIAAVKGGSMTANGDVDLTLTADEATTNGLLEITWDPSLMDYVSGMSTAQLSSFQPAEGKLLFGYAAEKEIASDAFLTMKSSSWTSRRFCSTRRIFPASRNSSTLSHLKRRCVPCEAARSFLNLRWSITQTSCFPSAASGGRTFFIPAADTAICSCRTPLKSGQRSSVGTGASTTGSPSSLAFRCSSRPSSGASSSTAFMTTARVTEGRKPSIAAKKTITVMPAPAVSRLRRRHSRRTTPSSSVTCMPETATMWEMPASDMAVCRA